MKETWRLVLEVEIEKSVSSLPRFVSRRLYSTPTYKIDLIKHELVRDK